jgi:hypothetical protein
MKKQITRMISAFVLLTLSAMALNPLALAENERGDYLYRVTTLRAAPGELLALIDLIKQQQENPGSDLAPFMMRHSQGDQWDLLLMYPMESFERYYGSARVTARAEYDRAFNDQVNRLAVFREDLFAEGPPLAAVAEAFAQNSLYHVEMFAALAGKHDELVRQREMENEFYRLRGHITNMIWVVVAGGDIDSFTIGFYADLQAFAAPMAGTPEQIEQAALDAGFKGRNFIGSYLRELLAYHHDTLAISVR